jgi:hypothetical protein
MTWLRRISPGRSAPAGLEWRLRRRLPAAALRTPGFSVPG